VACQVNRYRLYLGLLCGAQLGCVAVGLWIHERYASDAARRRVEQRAWTDLAAAAGEIIPSLQTLEAGSLKRDEARREAVQRLLSAAAQPHRVHITLVDKSWKVVLDGVGAAGDAPADPLTGRTLRWAPAREASGSEVQRGRGALETPDGAHMALSYPLKDGQGYILVHRPAAEVEAIAALVARSLPQAGLITFFWTVSLLSIAAYMIMTRFYDEMSRERAESEAKALRRAQALVHTRDAVIFGLAKLAESRDPETGSHLERMTLYCSTLAAALRRRPKFRNVVTPSFVQLIEVSSVLHDIGKVGVEDAILLKRGALTDAERLQMQSHTTIGGECLREIEQRLGTSNFLRMAREIALHHHERWDGTGYPAGLAGESIPLAARIVAIADVYDALSSRRIYKAPLPHEQCVALIRKEAGKAFDPELVDVFLENEWRFRAIAERYAARSKAAAEPVADEVVPNAAWPAKDLLTTAAREDNSGSGAVAVASLLPHEHSPRHHPVGGRTK